MDEEVKSWNPSRESDASFLTSVMWHRCLALAGGPWAPGIRDVAPLPGPSRGIPGSWHLWCGNVALPKPGHPGLLTSVMWQPGICDMAPLPGQSHQIIRVHSLNHSSANIRFFLGGGMSCEASRNEKDIVEVKAEKGKRDEKGKKIPNYFEINGRVWDKSDGGVEWEGVMSILGTLFK